MKVTIEIGGVAATVESDGITFNELAELFEQCALGAGFHHETVEGYYKEQA